MVTKKRSLYKKRMSAMEFYNYYNITALSPKKFMCKICWFQTVMNDVVKIVNFIKSRSLNHKVFKNFLNEIRDRC